MYTGITRIKVLKPNPAMSAGLVGSDIDIYSIDLSRWQSEVTCEFHEILCNTATHQLIRVVGWRNTSRREGP
jgi:hypothetical protein